MRLSNTIYTPIVTEKSFSLASQDRYVFEVNMRATKGSIKNEIQRLFGVDVIDVNTAIIPGKPKRIMRTRRFTKTPRWKKAIVQLKSGQKIDLVEAGGENA
jgi:large subunit ribosomal protein L23